MVADVLIFKGPDVLQQGFAVTVSAVPHLMLVRIITLLECLHGQTSVIPLLARRHDRVALTPLTALGMCRSAGSPP